MSQAWGRENVSFVIASNCFRDSSRCSSLSVSSCDFETLKTMKLLATTLNFFAHAVRFWRRQEGMFGQASRYYLSMSGQRIITDGVGILTEGQLTGLNGIEAASGSFANLSSQELALHEDQIAKNFVDILALQSGSNAIGAATQKALNLKLDVTAAPTRASLSISNVNNTSDLDKPLSLATQAALGGLAQENSMVVALANSVLYANWASGQFTLPSPAPYPPALQTALSYTVYAKYNRIVTVSVPIVIFKAFNNTGGSNVWSVAVSSVQYQINKNGTWWDAGTCGTAGLPRSFSVTRTANPTNTPPLPSRMFIANGTLTFIPEDSLVTDTYDVLISVTYTSTLSGATGAITTQESVQLNGTVSSFSGGGVASTLTSGSPGSKFASHFYSEAANNYSYPPTDSYVELKCNRIFANEVFAERIVMPPPCRNGSKLSSVSFDLKGLHSHDHTLSRRGYIRVAQARFMHSWANVDSSNNTVSAGGVIVTVAVGVYTAATLLTAILTAATGPLTGLKFDSSTGMYGGVVGNVSGSLGGIMGFSNGTFNRPANLIFTGSINIRVTNIITSNFSSVDSSENTLASVDVKAAPFEPIFYESGEWSEIENAHDLHRLDLEISDDRGSLIDFRGVQWKMVVYYRASTLLVDEPSG
ncbi:hypothetical protein B484DRAFT_428507 [Ochromonadaceae sp. CCMP2298]|nr:hypothetical protein B484DRAFT_428507 [Ochromonadaceae sp. CCMP2298]